MGWKGELGAEVGKRCSDRKRKELSKCANSKGQKKLMSFAKKSWPDLQCCAANMCCSWKYFLNFFHTH